MLVDINIDVCVKSVSGLQNIYSEKDLHSYINANIPIICVMEVISLKTNLVLNSIEFVPVRGQKYSIAMEGITWVLFFDEYKLGNELKENNCYIKNYPLEI